MSAALLASLFTAMVAGPVAASVTATSAGTFAPGTTSPSTVTFTFVETSAAAITAAGSLTVEINDTNGGDVTFTGTPSTLGSTGSLGASASIAGATLTVSWSSFDSTPTGTETIIVSGLKISAASTATPGPISATLAGTFAPFFAPSATTTAVASGVIQDSNTLTAGNDTADIILTSVCPFDLTSVNVVNSNATFSDAGESRAVTAVTAPVAPSDIYVVEFAAGTLTHPAGTTVTQTVSQLDCQTTLGSVVLPGAVGFIANALGFASAGNTNVFPGENNSPAANLTFTEPAAGFLTDGTTVTLTIKTAGVLFSTRPVATVTAGNLLLSGSIGLSNETQTLTLAGGGTTDSYTLGFGADTTGAILWNASAATVQAALVALPSIAAGDVTVTGAAGGPYTVTFGGVYAGLNVATLVATPTDVAPAGPFTVTVATPTPGGLPVLGAMTLSADHTSASFTVDTASTLASTIVVSNILYDVASTVAGGTFVTVEASAGGKLVNPTTRTNAVVGRGLNASATPTTVFIGQNNQKTGLVTITELAAGFFQGGTGTNNLIEVCLINNNETFSSPGPSAKVTAGDLVLRSGNVAAAAGAAVVGNAVFDPVSGDTCYTWKVWTASTVVSTITIGNSDFSSGPLINVPANSVPGAVNMGIFVGNGDVIPTSSAVAATVQIATAVFQNQVVVTALSQPAIARGATDARPGDIQIAETAGGQLKLGELICVEVLPRTSNNQLQDTFLRSLNTSDTPTVTPSGGVLVGPVALSEQGCSGELANNTHIRSFSFVVQQQSVSGTGKLVIGNMHYVTTADAPVGPVLVNVFGFGAAPTTVEFQATVSNATIVSAFAADAAITRGLNGRSNWTLATVVTTRGSYVTIRGRASGAGPGTLVQIWVKTKTTAWHLETNRRVSPNGFMYYSGKVLNLGYRYYRVVAAGATSNTVRAFGK